jgi:hypothetical protein
MADASEGRKEVTDMSFHYIYRDSITGKIVTQAYAEAHPDTTERERVED